jgi:2-polyprenyl-3-methyl-5-hydroxy-6-metoxy-1,4-benzoquinol methylase
VDRGTDWWGVSPAVPEADSWKDGAAYEAFMGRWRRLVVANFLGWLGVPAGKRWLDVGCGTGELSRAILERCDPAKVGGR